MKKNYRVSGLDCAGCASKLEKAINKVPGVSSAVLNFILSKLSVEAADGEFDAAMARVMAIIKKLEPDVALKEI